MIIWLYGDASKKLSSMAEKLIKENDLLISPMVRLELQYLYEIERLGSSPQTILEYLAAKKSRLKVCQKDFDLVVEEALKITWTRDAFDRLIVAHASLHNNILLTKDRRILEHYDHAVWNNNPETQLGD
ncbi:type II toxin-antitoxin system VapC family toxin [[Leptolyngbya] sp. PCC 7376]|uniref:type II toxin-antitoxin system VapC family toxin n=1 Tax=[Leptolyngbya] sp. PCC 7376 TaxID=111781 RepID=UPI001C1E2EC5|nr:PIN domain-containing protein [[Leptolyngbya] sp. PCC 7376]